MRPNVIPVRGPNTNVWLTICVLNLTRAPARVGNRMSRILRAFQVFRNVYAKLIASAAIGVLLVAGMIMNEQWSGDSIERSNASSRNQNAVVKAVMLAQQEYLRGQIERRNVVMAKSLPEAEKALADLKTAGAQAIVHAKTAMERAVDEENRPRLEKLTARLGDFLKLSLDMSGTRLDIFKMYRRHGDTLAAWNKGFAAVTKLPTYKESEELQTRMREALSAMMDPSIAYWRYSALQEPVILGRMYQSSDKVYIELQRARGATNDEPTLAAIDGVLSSTTAMNDVIDDTKKSFDTYLKLDREKNTPLRAELED